MSSLERHFAQLSSDGPIALIRIGEFESGVMAGNAGQVVLNVTLACGRLRLGGFSLPAMMGAYELERAIAEIEDAILPLAARFSGETTLWMHGADVLRESLSDGGPLIERIEATYQAQARLAMSGRSVGLGSEQMHCLLLLREISHHWPVKELCWDTTEILGG